MPQLNVPAFLQNLPRGWTCHLEEQSRRIYFHHDELDESVWFAVQCRARRAYKPEVSAKLRFARNHFQEKFGVSDLYFEEGERIMLISSQDDLWWEGELHGKTGIFPASFVRVERCSPIVELIREGIASDDAALPAAGEGGGEGGDGPHSYNAAVVEPLVAAMSPIQMRAVLNNFHIPWYTLSLQELRQYCLHIHRPELQAALFVTDAPPTKRPAARENAASNANSAINDNNNDNNNTKTKTSANTDSPMADASLLPVHGPILTELNFRRLLSGRDQEADNSASATPSQFGRHSLASRPPSLRVIYSPATPSMNLSVRTANAAVENDPDAQPASGISRRSSLNISGAPRLFSVHGSSPAMINATVEAGSPDTGSAVNRALGIPGSHKGKRSLARSGGAVRVTETTALDLRTNSIKTREQVMASPSRMSALQRVNARSGTEHSVLQGVDNEHGDVVKTGYLNILKMSAVSLMAQSDDGMVSSRTNVAALQRQEASQASPAATPNAGINSMLHTWHNRYFQLTAKTLGYSKKATEKPKLHNLWTLVGAKIRWIDKTNIHFESTVAAPSGGDAAGRKASNSRSLVQSSVVVVTLCAPTQRETNEWYQAIKRLCVPETSDSRAFLTLCRRGQIHAARKIIKDNAKAVHYRSPVDGWTALHHAAASSRPGVVDVLVRAKADLEITTYDGFRPIHLAAAAGCVTTFSKLQSLGADVNATTTSQVRETAAFLNGTEVAQALSCEEIAQTHGRSELVMHLCSQRAPAVKQHSVAAFHILQRKLIVAELHKTELRYVKGLLTLEKIYLPILVCGSPDEPVDLHSHIFDPKVAVITQAQARLIFSHISSICRQNEKFFEELNDLFTHWTADSLLGPLMDDFSTTFLLYTDFVSRLARINTCVDDLQNHNKAFQNRMKQCCQVAGPRLGFNLRTLLIEPVQRIPRYQMLVKTMLDYTPAQSPDFAPLRRALQSISNTANMINDNVAKFAELTILQRLGNRFTPPQILCVGSHRRFLANVDATVMAFEGELHSVQFTSDNDLPDAAGPHGGKNYWRQHTLKTKIKTGSQIVIVLLSDIVIFGKPYQFSDSLSFLGSLKLKDCQIEEQTSTPSRRSPSAGTSSQRGNAVYMLRSNCCFVKFMIKRSATQKMWFDDFSSHARLHVALTLRNSLRHTQSLGQKTLDTSRMVDQSAWLVVIDEIEAKDLRKMDVLSDSDPFVQFTIVPSQRNLAGGKKSKKSLNQRQGKHAFLSNFWKSNTYTIDNCHNPKYQCCCMLFLGNINEQVYGEDGPSLKVEVFDFDDDDSVPEPLGFAQVLLRELEPAIMQVNLPTFEKGGGRSVLSRSTSSRSRRGLVSEGSATSLREAKEASAEASSPRTDDIVARQLSEPVLEQTLGYPLRDEDGRSDGKKSTKCGSVGFRVKLFAIGASAVAGLSVTSSMKRLLSDQVIPL